MDGGTRSKAPSTDWESRAKRIDPLSIKTLPHLFLFHPPKSCRVPWLCPHALPHAKMIYKEVNAVALARLPASRTFPPYRLKTDASCNPTALLPRTPVFHPSLALSRTSKTHIHPEYSLFSAASRQLGLEERYIKTCRIFLPGVDPVSIPSIPAPHRLSLPKHAAHLSPLSLLPILDEPRTLNNPPHTGQREDQGEEPADVAPTFADEVNPTVSWFPSAPYRVFSEPIALEIDVARRR
ncbi:hypothetical protein B0H13DRAFT_2276917 [Mycena leptocephala]|nr:hypothetical protein B0H13DRAFT_2276917 [Mycena leptocephala]